MPEAARIASIDGTATDWDAAITCAKGACPERTWGTNQPSSMPTTRAPAANIAGGRNMVNNIRFFTWLFSAHNFETGSSVSSGKCHRGQAIAGRFWIRFVAELKDLPGLGLLRKNCWERERQVGLFRQTRRQGGAFVGCGAGVRRPGHVRGGRQSWIRVR